MSNQQENEYWDDDEEKECWIKFIDDLLEQPQSEKRNEIEQNARNFDYHNFKSRSCSCPKTMLYTHLQNAGYKDMAIEAVRGSYEF